MFLVVGAGGAIGAILRFLLSSLQPDSAFPIMTLLVNIGGAMAIGFASEAAEYMCLNKYYVSFFKAGICGGFTTFSTFSLESVSLIEKGKIFLASVYVIFSVLFCFLGILIGRAIFRMLCVRA